MTETPTTQASSGVAPAGAPPNPYVGPRPFRENELFFGREREATALVNTLLSGRVVLLHSPSGAGKTSLIQTLVVPTFTRRGFQMCAATRPRFSALRVNLPPPPGVSVPNRYVFSLVNGLVGNLVEQEHALGMTVLDALDMLADSHEGNGYQLVVLDQLEEILTLDPGDVAGQSEFFRQLGEALDDDRRWGLLAMREDYMGGLDRFQRYVPGHLRATFRLDFLDEAAALRAVQEPPRQRGVDFVDEAATMLVTDLRQVRSDSVDSPGGSVAYPYVEPVLLQVVCDSLWRRLSQRQGSAFTTITTDDVASFRPFGKTLSRYYSGVVREAARRDKSEERALRDWIDEHLVTKQLLRRPTRSRPAVADPDAALASMQSRYLVRDDPRPGGTWWELSHDMLITPVLDDNRRWRVANLAAWQVAAEDWQRSDHDRSLLLRGAAYRTARSLSRKTEPTPVEASFLEESRKMVAEDSTRSRLEAQVNFFRFVLGLSLVVNVVLLVLLLRRR